MKKIFLFLALFAGGSFAQGKNGALGLWLQGGNADEYWGMDYKHLGASIATDIYFRLAASNDNLSAGIYGGYYFLNNAIKSDASMGKFPLHYGPTVGLGYWNNGKGVGQNVGFAIRAGATGGISWIFPTSVPMDVSIELNPVAECHIVSAKGSDGKSYSSTNWEIPNLYFRLLFHVYIF
jgi:hypothetical protein